MGNLDTVLSFIDLWNSRDLDHILARMTEDCFYHNIPWPPMNGLAEIRSGLEMFVRDAEQIEWIVHHAAETEDGAVLTERTDRFLLKGQWLEISVMGTFELRDGKIARWRDYFDSAQFGAMMTAIG